MVAQRICLEDEGAQLLPAATTAGVQPQVTTEVEAEAGEGHLVDMTSTEEVLEVVGIVEVVVVVVIAGVLLAPLASLRRMFNLKYLLDCRPPSCRN